MLKRYYLIILIIVACSITNYSQWIYIDVFPDTSRAKGYLTQDYGVAGLAVDYDEKVWVVNNQANDRDSLYVAGKEERYVKASLIYVYNSDGSIHQFPQINGVIQENPIRFYRENGIVIDTVCGYTDANGTWQARTGKGAKLDPQGNIVLMMFDTYYKFNYKTGQGLKKLQPIAGANTAAAAFSFINEMFAANAGYGNPILQFDNTSWDFIGFAIKNTKGSTNSLEVDENGDEIYWSGDSIGYIQVYSRKDEFSSYDSVAIIPGFSSESICLNNNYLWANAGSDINPANRTPGVETCWSNNTFYAIDISDNYKVKESIEWIPSENETGLKIGGIAFTPLRYIGYKAYVAMAAGTKPGCAIRIYQFPAVDCWDYFGNPIECIKMTFGCPTKIEEKFAFDNTYSLSQNYPNPFNPETKIVYSLNRASKVKLIIYDILGREIETLVNDFKSTGTYSTTFNAQNLSSGIYVYSLITDYDRQFKKMVLNK